MLVILLILCVLWCVAVFQYSEKVHRLSTGAEWALCIGGSILIGWFI